MTTQLDFSDVGQQGFRSLRFHNATANQIRAAKRFSSETSDLTVSQAVKRLDECFYVLSKARAAGVEFGEAWDAYESP